MITRTFSTTRAALLTVLVVSGSATSAVAEVGRRAGSTPSAAEESRKVVVALSAKMLAKLVDPAQRQGVLEGRDRIRLALLQATGNKGD